MLVDLIRGFFLWLTSRAGFKAMSAQDQVAVAHDRTFVVERKRWFHSECGFNASQMSRE